MIISIATMIFGALYNGDKGITPFPFMIFAMCETAMYIAWVLR